jgi:hypothetical protein
LAAVRPVGSFRASFREMAPKRAVCLFAGTEEEMSAGSTIFGL